MSEDPTIRLERFTDAIDADDPDAAFKHDVASYSRQDPLLTLDNMSRNLGVPVGALARYVLVRWTAAGSEALLELGPSIVGQMSDVIAAAEAAGDDEARLAAYDKLRGMVSWLRVPLDDPGVNPAGGAEPTAE